MATTTNYGWTTPNDTDLVKDGAAAIRTLGSSIDTTTKALNPSTTLGDIEYRSSTANTNTRLGIGTSGQVLTVSAGVPAWTTISAGGMTLLSTTTLSGATTTISSIPSGYNALVGYVYGVTNATADGWFRMLPNNATNINNSQNIGGGGNVGTGTDSRVYLSDASATPGRTNADNFYFFRIDNYASSTNYKGIQINSAYFWPANGTPVGFFSTGGITTNSAITSLVFQNSGGNLSSGTVELYGVK